MKKKREAAENLSLETCDDLHDSADAVADLLRDNPAPLVTTEDLSACVDAEIARAIPELVHSCLAGDMSVDVAWKHLDEKLVEACFVKK